MATATTAGGRRTAGASRTFLADRWRWLEERPLLVVGLAAAVVRLGFALVTFLATDGYLIADEQQYIELATTVAGGRSAESWYPFFGQALYDQTWAYSAPLRVLFEVFGTSRLWGQLIAVVLGVVVAVLTTCLARRVMSARWAVAAGLLVALLPSQVLWSSVALRESTVWLGLILCALGFVWYLDDDRRRMGVGALVLAAGLLILGLSRDQTLLAAAWSLPLALLVVPVRHRLARLSGIVALVVVLPIFGGIGPAGWDLIERAVPALAINRALLADGAESSFTPTTVYVPDDGSSETPVTIIDEQGNSRVVVRAPTGARYLVDDALGDNLSYLPRGLVAVLFRPLVFESGSGSLRLASAESLLWYLAYVLAAVGLVRASWSRRRELAYPVISFAMIVAAAAVSQGNVGTAFRHRGQVLWIVAILAALGAEHLVAGRRRAGVAGQP